MDLFFNFIPQSYYSNILGYNPVARHITPLFIFRQKMEPDRQTWQAAFAQQRKTASL
jgi:hypothetical protein